MTIWTNLTMKDPMCTSKAQTNNLSLGKHNAMNSDRLKAALSCVCSVVPSNEIYVTGMKLTGSKQDQIQLK